MKTVSLNDIVELRRIYTELTEIAEKESNKLFRLARKAKVHGCADETVEAIRKEAWHLYHNISAYPERLLNPDMKWTYAFRGVISVCLNQ